MSELLHALSRLVEEVLLFLPQLVAALVVFALAVLAATPASRWARRQSARHIGRPETVELLARLTRWGVIGLGTLLALDIVDFNVTGFIAGLGLAGVTVGFALQDIARNSVAGVLLLIRQPFDIGDAVEVAGYAGNVQEITTRDTVLQTWDGELVIIPNIDVFTSAITNYTRSPLRRRTIRIALGYDQDVARASQLFLGALRGVDGVRIDPPPTVLAEELGNSTLTLVARFWVDQTTHSLPDVHSQAIQALKEAAEREGVDLSQSTQVVLLEGSHPPSSQ